MWIAIGVVVALLVVVLAWRGMREEPVRYKRSISRGTPPNLSEEVGAKRPKNPTPMRGTVSIDRPNLPEE